MSTVKTFECKIVHTIQIYLFHNIEILKDLWNLTQTFNNTPLNHAAAKGHTEAVKLLLSQRGIDINCKNI